MLILASKSPRRKELLEKIYPFPFQIIPADIDEAKIKAPSLRERPFYIAKAKGEKISTLYKDAYVISADTTVICQGQELGKPKDAADARRMLKMEDESYQEVLTGYHIFFHGKDVFSGLASTKLVLHGLTDEKIEEYLKTGSPFDKAGAYGIQDREDISYTISDGSFDNVMGFPTDEIKKGLAKLGLI